MRMILTMWASLLTIWPFSHQSTVVRPAAVINQVLTSKKVVALTFDDGPTRTWTPQVLKILHDNHVSATFFVIGSHAEKRPDILTQEVRDHEDVESHGFQHRVLRGQTAAVVSQEVTQNEALLVSLGVPKPSLYRMPGGASDSVARQVLGAMHYQIIGWSIDTRDWRHRATGDEMASQIMRQVEPGAIVIFHDGPNSSAATIQAVKDVIPELKHAGWKIDTVSAMLKLEKHRPQ